MTRYCTSCNNPKSSNVAGVGNPEFCKICRAATKSYEANQPRIDILSTGKFSVSRLEGSGSSYPIAEKPINTELTQEQIIERIWKLDATRRLKIANKEQQKLVQRKQRKQQEGQKKETKTKKEKQTVNVIFQQIEKLNQIWNGGKTSNRQPK